MKLLFDLFPVILFFVSFKYSEKNPELAASWVSSLLGSAAVEKPYHVKNLHATILNQLGMDPNRLSYFHGGLDQKLVGVEHIEPIKDIIA